MNIIIYLRSPDVDAVGIIICPPFIIQTTV